jgi:protein phosphatase
MSSTPPDVNLSSSNCIFHVGLASLMGAREENQDRVRHFDSPFGHVFVLADGMGGYKGGAHAADIATSKLSGLLSALPGSMTPRDALVDSIEQLNCLILEESRVVASETEGMGSTLAILLVRDTSDGSFAIGAHVGDSRIYFLRREHLFCLTRDHTVVRRLVDSGALTPEQAATHPQAGVLTRALGRVESVPADVTPWIQAQPDDVFLLCSDGLSGYVGDDAIRDALLRREPAQAVADALVTLALRVRSDDNISVLIVRAERDPGRDS